MKAVLLLAILLGFGGTLAGAHYMPGLRHARLPSHTSVVANGGRAEQFLIRLPADRIAATDGPAGGLRTAGTAQVMALPAGLAADSTVVEHFKVRDVEGHVIGVAARHWTASANGASTTWSVFIPSRGTMVLNAPGEASAVVERALERSGYGSGKPWSGQVAVAMTPADGQGAVATGTGEFAGLGGSYTETWVVAGIDDAGRLLGNIELNTVTSKLP